MGIKWFKVHRWSWAIAALLSFSLILLHQYLAPAQPAVKPNQAEVFNQVWETVNSNFYDPKFNGVDWQAVRKKYSAAAERADSRESFAAVINQMLAELKSSHTFYYTPDSPAYYQVLGIFTPRSSELRQQIKPFFPKGNPEYSGIGIVTRSIDNKTFVSAIFDGSPAAQAGLMVGDQILSVDGKPFQAVQSFTGKAGQKVTVRVQRSPSADSQRDITVTPKTFDATTMFLDAQRASNKTFQRDGKRIGYTHIWSYAGDQFQQQLEEDLIYGELSKADALVLDLRDGWGGAPLTALNIYGQRDLSIASISRSGRRYVSYAQWNKPVVMLVNEGSRSAKEILAFGFQRYRIGTVVGTPTAGAVLAGSPFLMKDGSLLYLAVANVFVNENQRLEGKGVTPDVMIPFTPEYTQGNDPQREKAITIARSSVK
jgi:carboxyl-terminal processing protease